MRPKNISEYTLVRITKNEMDQLLMKKVGDTFLHINLQHSGLMQEKFLLRKHLMVLIAQNGKDNGSQMDHPKLDYKKPVQVEFLRGDFSIPVTNLDKYVNNLVEFGTSDFLLDNKMSLLESLYDKYTSVRGLSKDKILEMECYIRKFKILKFL